MVLHVYCVVTGGIPLFYRSSSEATPLSFSELAPLNGIQVFGKVYSVTFQSAEGKEFHIYWKNFTERLSLILISKYSVCDNGKLILNSIFDVMILTVGLDELNTVKHVDRLKKEIRPSYSLIDDILRSVDEFSETAEQPRLLSMVPLSPCINSNILQEKLNDWSENISSLFCSLIVNGKVIVATPAWWDLTAVERSLLLSLIVINRDFTTVDIPVFLPVKSPKIAFRLVACRLMANTWVNALCGPTPSITEFERSTAYCWNSVSEILFEIPSSIPVFIPEQMSSQNGIFGSLFINQEVGSYILLGSANEDKYHFDTLRIFYYQNIKELLGENGKIEDHKIKETYWYAESYKLYGIVSQPYILCLLTSSIIPTSSVRSISKDMLSVIMNEKLISNCK